MPMGDDVQRQNEAKCDHNPDPEPLLEDLPRANREKVRSSAFEQNPTAQPGIRTCSEVSLIPVLMLKDTDCPTNL